MISPVSPGLSAPESYVLISEIVESSVFPGKTSWASGRPSCVTMSAISICTQSKRGRGCNRPGACPSHRAADRLEVGARQLVKQHLEGDVEQVTSAIRQMAKQRLLVPQQPTMAPVQQVRIGERITSAPSKSASAVRPYHSRCNRHSLPGSISRYAVGTMSSRFQRVPLREQGRRSVHNTSTSSIRHSINANQHAPRCRDGRCGCSDLRFRRTIDSSGSTPSQRSSQNSAYVRGASREPSLSNT